MVRILFKFVPANAEAKRQMFAVLLAFVFTISGTIEVSAKGTQKTNEPRVTWQKCWFTGGIGWPDAQCGHLSVPESRHKDDGKTVTLPFIIFEALEPNSGYPPVFVTGGGGPGNPLGIDPEDKDAIRYNVWNDLYFSSVEAGRALIVMDNRGVGSARPRLTCPEVNAQEVDLLSKAVDTEKSVELRVKAYAACKRRLTAAGIDVSAYNNEAAASDIESLRRLLGFRRISLYGVSYGTRIALTYMRLFPEYLHAVILDGTEPPEIDYYELVPRQDFISLKKIFDRCFDQDACRDRFGRDLFARFVKFLAELEKKPVTIRVTNPKDLKPIDIALTPEIVVTTIFSAMYYDKQMVKVPRAVAALINGSYDYIGELIRDEIVYNITVSPLDAGANASYQCVDEGFFNDFDRAAAEAAKYPLQQYMNLPYMLRDKEICKLWTQPPTDTSESNPVKSEVPVLFLSGEFDPATPAVWAKETETNFTNSWHKVWKGFGHGIIAASECADKVAAKFLSNPWSDPATLKCATISKKLEFEVD